MQVGRLLIAAGLGLVVFGVIAMIAARLNLPFGRLPGDFVWRGKNSVVYFPWVNLSGVEFVGDGFVVDGESAVGITDDWD